MHESLPGNPGQPFHRRSFPLAGNHGLRLMGTIWHAPDPRAVVLFAHGYTAYAAGYSCAIERLAASGCTVMALDHRGHGSSEGKRASLRRFDDYIDDFERLAEQAREQFQDLPVFSLGHSMGGLIVFRHALRVYSGLAGVVAVSPAFVVGDGVSPLMVSALRVLSGLFPDLPLISNEPRFDASDGEVPRSKTHSLFSYHGRTRLAFAREIYTAGLDSLARASEMTVPILLQHGALDTVTMPRGSAEAFERVSSVDRSLNIWDDRYHNLLTEQCWEDVIDQGCQWILQRVSQPSG